MFYINYILLLTATYFILPSSGSETEFFQIPNRKYISVNENVTISCRTKKMDPNSFLFKRHGAVMIFKCKSLIDETVQVKCGEIDSWYYMNATIPKLKWEYRGEYLCLNDQTVKKLDLILSNSSPIKMKVDSVSYKSNKNKQSSQYKEETIKAPGTIMQPFKLFSRDIENVNVSCSNNWAFPIAKYQWTVTKLNVKGLQSAASETLKETSVVSLFSNETVVKDMSKTKSILQVNCLKLDIEGMFRINCENLNEENEELHSQNYHFVCPDKDSLSKANSSRVISKKMLTRITTGEMVNIVIGCTIGMILLISGIILICRHRTKDDMERYTMRQNSMEHSGYRV